MGALPRASQWVPVVLNRILMTPPGDVNTFLLMPEKRHPYVEIGERIAEARRVAGKRRGARLTQRELASVLRVSEGTVTAWEIGKQRPEGENLVRLATSLGVSPAFLLTGGTEEETPEEAVAESELDVGLAVVDRVVRLVSGKEGLSDEDRRDLKKAILNEYIDEFQEHGRDPAPLYIRLAKVDRGEI